MKRPQPLGMKDSHSLIIMDIIIIDILALSRVRLKEHT